MNESPVRLHRRQFVIGPQPFEEVSGWTHRQLGPSTRVSHCPDLRAAWARDMEGNAWGILGLAVESREEFADPLSQIAASASSKIASQYSGWAGRWVLIGRDTVHVDAAALLCVFYGRDRQGRTWASSSPALLQQIIAEDDSSHDNQRQLRYETGISWFPPPQSRFARVRRLLPSQILDLSTGEVRARPLLPLIDPSIDFDAALDALQRSLVTTIRRLPLDGKPLWMSLSAGADSRVVLAAAHLAGVKMTCFTRISARMSLGDRMIPPQLASALGHEHVFFRPGRARRPPGRLELVMNHCRRHVSEGDALPLVQGVRDSLSGISIGGQCFGVGKILGRTLPDQLGDLQHGASAIARVLGEPIGSTAIAGIREWLEWVAQTPHANLDWRDRFYIEQRLAGWQSSKEQVYDLAVLERFPVINAARNYALLLSMPEDRRRKVKHHRELIARAVPKVADFPINPMDREFGILRAVILKTRDDPFYLGRKIAGEFKRLRRSSDGPHQH